MTVLSAKKDGGKYGHIDFKPPKGVAEAAERGLELRKETGEGGLSTKEAGKMKIGSGVARAVSLSKRQNQSPETIRMMVGFFARHSAYKKKHKKEPKGPARISWLLWGGDPGEAWANKIKNQMERADEKAKKSKSSASAHHPPSSMTLENLEQIIRDIKDLVGLIDPEDELEGWVEDLVSQSKTQLSNVTNYLENKEDPTIIASKEDGDSDYVPKKYLGSLKGKERKSRRREIDVRRDEPSDDPKSYRPFRSDKDPKTGEPRKTRRSEHTLAYEKMFGKPKASTVSADAKLDKALKNKSDASGVPVSILRQVYKRGLAAWRTGHRPGANQHQWGMARVNSFLTGGKTRYTADKDLWEKHKSKASTLSGMAFPKPHDAWKKLRGKLPIPTEFEGHEGVWEDKIAPRLGVSPKASVEQRAPVIGGRRRYHHRPLTTWKLQGRKGFLTLTTDPMEAKTWNRLKSKRHVAMPRIKDVFEVRLKGDKKLWAIHHEPLSYPPEEDWYLFIDTFFRWRAMSKDALKPAKESDLKEFLEWVLIPEREDVRVQQRRRQEIAIPFNLKQKRDDKIEKVRKQIWMDTGLKEKVKWAKSTLAFLAKNKIAHRDLDPSNLGKTAKGRTVITNLAESRSQGKNIGRIGRVRGSYNTISSSKSSFAQTVQAIHSLMEPEAPELTSVQLLSGSGRRVYGLVHMDEHMRAAVLAAAGVGSFDPAKVEKGLSKLFKFAEMHGEKAYRLYDKVVLSLEGM